MHDTAYLIGSKFLELYIKDETRVIFELGALDVNGTLRNACPADILYVGADIQQGSGVDIVVQANEPLPFLSDCADLVISTSQLEHDPCFWQTFLELARVLRPGGFLYLNSPSNGAYHRYPWDMWRFYPDAAVGLAKWAKKNHQSLFLIESFISEQSDHRWNDFIAVFSKGEIEQAPIFLSERFTSFNVHTCNSTEVLRLRPETQDQTMIIELQRELAVANEKLTAYEDDFRRRENKNSSIAGSCLERMATTTEAYDFDALRSIHNHAFMNEPGFKDAYARGMKAADQDYKWYWRVHIGLWAARHASTLPGDFVECGVNRGFLSSAIMHMLDWDKTGRTFYLMDTFAGLDPRYITEEERANGALERTQHERDVGFLVTGSELARQNFAEWRNVRLIEGPIPDTLGQVTPREIAFMHIDMNCSPPEIAAMRHFWDRLVPGALVVFDDYAYYGYRTQKVAVDAFAKTNGVEVVSLPTGQGLLIKPGPLPKWSGILSRFIKGWSG